MFEKLVRRTALIFAKEELPQHQLLILRNTYLFPESSIIFFLGETFKKLLLAIIFKNLTKLSSFYKKIVKMPFSW